MIFKKSVKKCQKNLTCLLVYFFLYFLITWLFFFHMTIWNFRFCPRFFLQSPLEKNIPFLRFLKKKCRILPKSCIFFSKISNCSFSELRRSYEYRFGVRAGFDWNFWKSYVDFWKSDVDFQIFDLNFQIDRSRRLEGVERADLIHGMLCFRIL